jgi:putative zinc finger protein
MSTESNPSHPDALLAWFANGTLEPAERVEVERHLRGCARCRDEVAFLGALRHGVKALAAAGGPGELGRKRLLRDLRAERRAARAWWRPALAAAAAVIVVQGVVLAGLWWREAAIVPLGGPKTGGPTVQIQFAPTATEAQMRALLQEVGASLIDGPGAAGVYRARVENADTALAKLRARADVVKHAAGE